MLLTFHSAAHCISVNHHVQFHHYHCRHYCMSLVCWWLKLCSHLKHSSSFMTVLCATTWLFIVESHDPVNKHHCPPQLLLNFILLVFLGIYVVDLLPAARQEVFSVLEKCFSVFSPTVVSTFEYNSARPTFTLWDHPLVSNKLYCLVTEAHGCEQLLRNCYAASPYQGIKPWHEGTNTTPYALSL